MTDHSPPAAVLAYLTDAMRRDDAGNPYWTDDSGLVILDVNRDGCPPADARTVAAWTRQHRRDLWAGESAAPAATATAPSSAADLMAQAKAGTISATEAANRLLGSQPAAAASPQPGGPLNFTTLMQAARAGDVAALERLRSMVHTK